MKKILYSVFALAVAAFTFTSCEDVPAPYDDPNDNPIDQPEVIEPAGEGTAESPYNVARTLEVAGALASGESSESEVHIKGVVIGIDENYDGGFGNAEFTIADDEDANDGFLVYRANYFNNKKYSDGPILEFGDTVVICGILTNYNGTLETASGKAYLVSLNGYTGEEEGGDEPSVDGAEGDGTLENPFNSIAAYSYTASLEADVNSENAVYIKGIVSKIEENYAAKFGNASYYISVDGTFDSDDSGNQFYVFRSLYLDNEKYTEGDLLSVGDEVVVYGKVVNYYGNTPETVSGQSYLYSWKKGEGGATEDVGDPEALNGDFECWIGGQPNNWQTESSAGNASLSMSTDAHGGNYSVKVAGNTGSNKRISYKELELEPGDYTMTFYAKAATDAGASARPGYVQVTDGKVGNYQYGDYTNGLTNTEWTQITHTFTIAEKGIYCVLVMNSKSPGGDLLIDDFKLTCGSSIIIE